MKKEEFNEGLNDIDFDIVEDHIEQRKILSEKKKLRRSLFIKWGTVAACFLVALVMIVDKLSLLPPPVYNNAAYSAKELFDRFGDHNSGGPTSVYKEVFVKSADMLNVNPIPTDEYIEVFKDKNLKKSINKSEFNDFFNPILFRYTQLINKEMPDYKIESDPRDGNRLNVSIENLAEYELRAFQTQESNGVVFGYGGQFDEYGTMTLNGHNVEIDQRKSNDEIIEDLKDIRDNLFYLFGVEFKDTKVIRDYYSGYYKYGADNIFIYYYNESDHPYNSMSEHPITDCICIHFENVKNREDDVVSDTILKKVGISYTKNRVDMKKSMAVSKYVKMLPLSKAEELLSKGYVFGGHLCSDCISDQTPVDFGEYDFVGIEYHFEFNEDSNEPPEGIPFYAFYKNIGMTANGNQIYAEAYVPAIEISGYEEYFEEEYARIHGKITVE